MSIMTKAKTERLATLAELALAGVPVTVCKPGKARGVRKQTMKTAGAKGFVVGGDRPNGVKAANWG